MDDEAIPEPLKAEEGFGTTGSPISQRNGHFRNAEDQGTAFRTRVRRERCLLLGVSKGRGAGRKGQPPAAENKSQASPSQGCIGKSRHVI